MAKQGVLQVLLSCDLKTVFNSLILPFITKDFETQLRYIQTVHDELPQTVFVLSFQKVLYSIFFHFQCIYFIYLKYH